MPIRQKFETVEQYIQAMPAAAQPKLREMRAALQAALPDATEVISYNIAAFKLKKVVIFYAGYAGHVSVHPVPSGDAAFEEQVARYQKGKGTLRFELDQPLPLDFIQQVARNLRKDRHED